jgi:hypothetical protein
MIFTYKEEKDGFTYECEDFIGKIKLKSKKRLAPAILDTCVLKLSNMSGGIGTFRDDKNNNDIAFEFEKTEVWSEEDLKDNENPYYGYKIKRLECGE